MSSYTKQERCALLASRNGGKTVFQALASAELNAHSANPEAQLHDLKASLVKGKKHSSATLLRRKLEGHLVREWREI